MPINPEQATDQFNRTTLSVKLANAKIVRAYKTALDSIRVELSILNEKDVLTSTQMRQYNRLPTLMGKIQDEIRAVKTVTNSTINSQKVSVFRDAYNHTFTDLDISFTKLPSDTIKAFLQASAPVKLSRITQNLSTSTLTRTEGAISQGLVQDLSIAAIIALIKEAFGSAAKRATRITQQELLRSMSEAHVEANNELKKEGWKIESIWQHWPWASKEPRIDHGDMEGDESVDGLFTYPSGWVTRGPRLSTIPEEDINCHCSVYDVVKQRPDGSIPGDD